MTIPVQDAQLIRRKDAASGSGTRSGRSGCARSHSDTVVTSPAKQTDKHTH